MTSFIIPIPLTKGSNSLGSPFKPLKNFVGLESYVVRRAKDGLDPDPQTIKEV